MKLATRTGELGKPSRRPAIEHVTGPFHAELPDIPARKTTCLVFTDKLPVRRKPVSEDSRRPAKIISRHLVARFILRIDIIIAPVVAAKQKIKKRARIARPPLSAPLGRTGQANLKRWQRPKRETHTEELRIGNMSLALELAKHHIEVPRPYPAQPLRLERVGEHAIDHE